MADDLVKLMVLQALLSDAPSDNDISKIPLVDVGLRVVRGPDWKWKDQDGGEGHVGTVIEIGKQDTDAFRTVTVLWDSGDRNAYRFAHHGRFDLRILDNASLGVRHPSVTCSSCQKKSIVGMRWKCKMCENYNLCTLCYMCDKHDVMHPFLRLITINSSWVELPKRQGATKFQMRGIFASAKVVRGSDWEWGSQDGGPGKIGLVTNLSDWKNSQCNAAYVKWEADNSMKKYRLGYKGKVDLKYIEDAADGYYYRDHLPILGDEVRAIKAEECENTSVKEVSSPTGGKQKNIGECQENSMKEVSSSIGLTLLSKDLKDLFFSDQFCDIVITVKDRTFPTHKAILCARSSVFASKIKYSMEDSNILEISDCDPEIFENFLFYLYTGKMKTICNANVSALYEIAIKYDVQSLRDECINFHVKGFSMNSIYDYVAVA